MTILESMTQNYNSFTKLGKKLADYCFSHAKEVAYQSISTLAEESGVSEATITRTDDDAKPNQFEFRKADAVINFALNTALGAVARQNGYNSALEQYNSAKAAYEQYLDDVLESVRVVRRDLGNERLVGDGLSALGGSQFTDVVVSYGVDIRCSRGVVGDDAGNRARIHSLDFDLVSEIGMGGKIFVAYFLIEFSRLFADPDTDHSVV